MTDQLSLQAGRVTVFQDVDDTTAFTVEVTKDGNPVDLSGSTWADPDGLMTVDTTNAASGKLGLSCGVQTGNQDWRLQADGDTTWLQGLLHVGSTRRVGAGTGTVSVAVENQTVTVSAVVPTHDHAGTYLEPGDAVPAASVAGKIERITRTAGNLTLNSTAWADLENTLDLALTVEAGQWIEVGISGRWGAEAVWAFLDVVTVVSAAPNRSVTTQAAAPSNRGMQGWAGSSGHPVLIGPTVPYLVDASDVVSGLVTLRWRYITLTAANRTLSANSNDPLDVWARVLG